VSANDRLERLQQEHNLFGGGSGAQVEELPHQNFVEDQNFDEATGLVC
jgi:hypothetical protein